MNLLMDPNVGYTLLMGGLVLAVLALFIPGTGLLEIGALFALVLAGVVMVNIPINSWALLVMAVAIIPLVLAIRSKRGSLALMIGSAVVLLGGSLFVFRAPNGGPAVNPFLAFVISVGSVAFLWFVGRKAFEAAHIRPTHSQDRVIGAVGTAVTDLRPEGSVYVGGENWSARSREYISAGTPVRVLKRDGLVLDVEKDQ
jgi:membrane-bound serine protease (ClpP class)